MRCWVAMMSVAALGASSCSSPNLVGRTDLTIVSGSALPPPATVDLIAEERAFLIGPMDQVSIDIYGLPELSRSVQVDASGRVSMPLIGTIEASGKTPAQLSELIAGRLRGRYVRDPQVTVNLTQTVSQVVTVDGEVRSPGLYPVIGRMTLMRSIARAQGVTEFARQTHVVVFRRVNNQEMAALYDLRAIRQGIYEDPEIFANDVVLVGESQARRLFQAALQASGVLTAPLIALVQQSSSP